MKTTTNKHYILVHKGEYFTSNREFNSNINRAYVYSEEKATQAIKEFSYMGMKVTMEEIK